MKKLISLLLIICLTLSLAPASLAAEGVDSAEGDGTRYFVDQYHDQDIDLKTLEVTPVTQADADRLCAALNALLADPNATDEAVDAAFQAIDTARATALTNYEFLYFRSTLDVNDASAARQSSDYYNLGVAISDMQRTAIRDILASSHAAYFIEAEALTAAQVSYYRNYEPMTDQEKALIAQLNDIEPEYNAAYVNGIPVTCEGVEYTFESLDEAYAAGQVDADTANTIYALLVDATTRGLGQLYLRMLDVTGRIADLYGYDNYADYAYPNEYGRDFTPEEIQVYFDAVKEYIAPLAVKLRQIRENDFTDFYFSGEEAQAIYNGDYTGEDTLDDIEACLSELSPELLESFQYMREHNLYDIQPGAGKKSGAYTSLLESYGAPYLFSSPDGYMGDLSTVVHEFGHYNNFYWHPCGWNDATANTDIAEVHSQGLELLFAQFYEDFFGKEGAELAEDTLMDSLVTYAILYGAFFGELELYAHTTPGVTYEDICDKFAELSGEYLLDDPMDWQSLPHLTVRPLYYVSYSVSAAGAAAFWLEAQETSYDAALDKYLSFVALDPAMDFQAQFEALDLPDPLSAEFIEQLADDLSEALDVDERVYPKLFRDVPVDSEYYEYITYLALRHYLNGDGTGRFDPDGPADRAQMIQMLYNCFALKGEENTNPLTDIDGKWYEDAAAWAYTRQITTGFIDPDTGTLVFGGGDILDRQTMFTLLCRTLERFGISCEPTGSYTYTDQVAGWARDAVDFLYENNIIEADENGVIGAAEPVTRGDLATYIYWLFQVVNG